MSHLLAETFRVEDILAKALEGLEESLGARGGTIYEVDWAAGELVFRLARGAKAGELEARRMKIGEGVAGWVAQSGRPKLVGEAYLDEHFHSGIDRETGFVTRSLLTVPLIARGTVIGVVQLVNKIGDAVFTREDLELAEIMGGQIAVALENARLYARLEEKQAATMEELVRTQERLVRSQRQAALAGLAAGIAHHLRNPAMSIGGFARRIMDKPEAGRDRIAQWASVIVDENRRIEELVRRVAFLTGLDPHLEPGDLRAVLEAALAAHDPGLEVTWETAGVLPRLPMDAALVQAALAELLTNAREAGATAVRLSLAVDGRFLCLGVADNGSGIPGDVRAAALDPFFSTHARNLGLGLTVAQRIIQAHQGELRLSDNDGPGAVVTLCFPLP